MCTQKFPLVNNLRIEEFPNEDETKYMLVPYSLAAVSNKKPQFTPPHRAVDNRVAIFEWEMFGESWLVRGSLLAIRNTMNVPCMYREGLKEISEGRGLFGNLQYDCQSDL
jgi:hypothetical protein